MSILSIARTIPAFTVICFLLANPSSGSCQPSIIETIQGAMPSLVDVTADGTVMAQAARPAAAIDKSTGKVIVLRNVKAAYFKKNGAGIIIDPSGVIVTNYHTVSNAKRIKITLYDKTETDAQLLQAYPNEDLVLLRIVPPYPLTPVSFADSNSLKLNEEVFTVGHSSVLDQTISGGQIIGLGSSRTKDSGGPDVFQVNINIYKGDSGGPLLNRRGEFIGLMTAGQIEKDRSSFAIASNKIRKYFLEYAHNLKQ